MTTTDCEKLEKAKSLEQIAERIDKLNDFFSDFVEKTNTLQADMTKHDLKFEQTFLLNGLLDLQLRINYLQTCVYDKIDELRQDKPEPLDCRICKRRVF